MVDNCLDLLRCFGPQVAEMVGVRREPDVAISIRLEQQNKMNGRAADVEFAELLVDSKGQWTRTFVRPRPGAPSRLKWDKRAWMRTDLPQRGVARRGRGARGRWPRESAQD